MSYVTPKEDIDNEGDSTHMAYSTDRLKTFLNASANGLIIASNTNTSVVQLQQQLQKIRGRLHSYRYASYTVEPLVARYPTPPSNPSALMVNNMTTLLNSTDTV
jgi:hypothetical protein